MSENIAVLYVRYSILLFYSPSFAGTVVCKFCAVVLVTNFWIGLRNLNSKNIVIIIMLLDACFACESANRHMYWCCYREIYKADLNGANVVQLYLTSSLNIFDLALDSSGECDIIHQVRMFSFLFHRSHCLSIAFH